MATAGVFIAGKLPGKRETTKLPSFIPSLSKKTLSSMPCYMSIQEDNPGDQRKNKYTAEKEGDRLDTFLSWSNHTKAHLFLSLSRG